MIAMRADELNSVTQSLDQLFSPWNKSDAPGLVVGVALGGAPIYRKGFGLASLEAEAINTPKTRMRIASTTKQFTAFLALLLAEDGRLDLDAPIRQYLPELGGPAGDPSVRLLLQHRGGSRCSVDLSYLANGMRPPPVGSSLSYQVRQRERNFLPGEAMIYNNGGYHLLSIAIERAGAAPFEVQLSNRIFGPLGMLDTTCVASDYLITRGIATLHEKDAQGAWRRGLFPSKEIRGDGAIVSTIDDMLLWMDLLRRRDKLGSPRTWEALTEKPRFPDGSEGHYALGLIVDTYRGLPRLHHAGAVHGGASQMITFPEHGLDVIILANGAPGAEPWTLADGVADIALENQLGERRRFVDATQHADLLGDWFTEQGSVPYKLLDEGGLLKVAVSGNTSGIPLEAVGGGVAVARARGLGPVFVNIRDSSAENSLEIRFGGRSLVYKRGTAGDQDCLAFQRMSLGTYYSHDADCTAKIALRDGALALELKGVTGSVQSALIRPLSQRLGILSPATAADTLNGAIELSPGAAMVPSFALNTMRTRALVFERVN